MQDRFDRVLASLGIDRPLLVAVSGGVDSMVLLDLLDRSATAAGFVVAHCDFHLRGEESDADAVFVEEMAASRGRKFVKADFDTTAYAHSLGISIEMAARELRYSWFAEQCKALGLCGVAVAHNANDQAETMVLNLLRGTGLRGMVGMRPVSPLLGDPDLRLFRPLLEFTRKEISEYASSCLLPWREDSSNSDSTYKRNLVRNEVFPLFERLNPSFLDTFTEDSRRFGQAQAVVDDLVEAAVGRVIVSSAGDLRVSLSRLMEERHWDYVLFSIFNPLGFNPSTIDDLVSVLRGQSAVAGKTFLSPERIAVTTSSEIVVSKRGTPVSSSVSERDSSSLEELVVEGPGAYSLKGRSFKVSLLPVSAFARTAGSGFRLAVPEGTIAADASKLRFPFIVRGWRAGDWIRPIGLGGRKKLSDLFVDLKTGLPEKERALVIQGDGTRVLALLGKRVDESVMAGGATESLVAIELA